MEKKIVIKLPVRITELCITDRSTKKNEKKEEEVEAQQKNLYWRQAMLYSFTSYTRRLGVGPEKTGQLVNSLVTNCEVKHASRNWMPKQEKQQASASATAASSSP